MSPLKRFYNLLLLDKKDVLQLFFYAIFAGIISLSLPLGIQAIINFIQSGRVSVSWILLVVFICFGCGTRGCFINDATPNYRKFATKNIHSIVV